VGHEIGHDPWRDSCGRHRRRAQVFLRSWGCCGCRKLPSGSESPSPQNGGNSAPRWFCQGLRFRERENEMEEDRWGSNMPSGQGYRPEAHDRLYLSTSSIEGPGGVCGLAGGPRTSPRTPTSITACFSDHPPPGRPGPVIFQGLHRGGRAHFPGRAACGWVDNRDEYMHADRRTPIRDPGASGD